MRFVDISSIVCMATRGQPNVIASPNFQSIKLNLMGNLCVCVCEYESCKVATAIATATTAVTMTAAVMMATAMAAQETLQRFNTVSINSNGKERYFFVLFCVCRYFAVFLFRFQFYFEWSTVSLAFCTLTYPHQHKKSNDIHVK